MRLLLLCLFCFSIANSAHAAVTMSEIAWMGTVVSANDEWIELHNDGESSVSLDGWVLSDDMSLEVHLSGSIAAGEYAVLERTDDASAPGSAFLIYTGALANGGATLSLYTADNSLADRIVGSENWENIGGDNITKETAQYTASGWITAIGTPGSAPTGEIAGNEEESDNNNNDPAVEAEADEETSGGSVPTLHLEPRTPRVLIDGPKRVYEDQTVTFTAESYGLADGILQSFTYQWNFGDTYTQTGKEVMHHFRHPGEYVVTLYGFYKDYEATARMTVVVLPVSFSLGTNGDGDVLVHNDARYEIDLSGYTLRGVGSFIFPERTIMLPGATIAVPKERVLAWHGTAVTLLDTQTQIVAQLGSSVSVSEPVAPIAVVQRMVPTPVVSETAPISESFVFVGEEPVATTSLLEDVPQESVTQQATAIEAGASVPAALWPYLALFGIVGLGLLAVFAGRVRSDV